MSTKVLQHWHRMEGNCTVIILLDTIKYNVTFSNSIIASGMDQKLEIFSVTACPGKKLQSCSNFGNGTITMICFSMLIDAVIDILSVLCRSLYIKHMFSTGRHT